MNFLSATLNKRLGPVQNGGRSVFRTQRKFENSAVQLSYGGLQSIARGSVDRARTQFSDAVFQAPRWERLNHRLQNDCRISELYDALCKQSVHTAVAVAT